MLHKRHNRMFKSVATAATVAIAAAMIAVGAPAASAAPRVINVKGVITGFTPKTITVKAGEQVSICLSKDVMPHDITIADPAFKVASGACATLTAPAAAGTHEFICSIDGHKQAGMVGSLVVTAAGAAAPAAPGADAPAADPQVADVPVGGVQTGGGSTAGLNNVNLLMLGGGLLIAAMMSVLLGTRVTRRD